MLFVVVVEGRSRDVWERKEVLNRVSDRSIYIKQGPETLVQEVVRLKYWRHNRHSHVHARPPLSYNKASQSRVHIKRNDDQARCCV